jgi:hypothetical protein
MGNISVAIKKRTRTSAGLLNVVDITFSNSYATGGDVLPSNAALGLEQSLDCIDPIGSGPTGQTLVVDLANRKILAYVRTTGVQVANAVDLSAVTIRALVYGDMPNV